MADVPATPKMPKSTSITSGQLLSQRTPITVVNRLLTLEVPGLDDVLVAPLFEKPFSDDEALSKASAYLEVLARREVGSFEVKRGTEEDPLPMAGESLEPPRTDPEERLGRTPGRASGRGLGRALYSSYSEVIVALAIARL